MQQTPAKPPMRQQAGATISVAEASRHANEFIGLMNALLAVLEEETELVRAGRLAQAAALADQKAELAGRYLAETQRLKAGAAAWFRGAPQILDELQRRQELFRSLLQVNLTVLATAHAVAEGLIRGAASEVARQGLPQGYGSRGYAVTPPPRSAQPIAISRSY